MAAPELIHVATMKAQLGEQLLIPEGPMGTRVVAEVDSVSVEGERINATMAGKSAADWLTLGPEGHGTLDVRVTLRTDDDALIYMEYGGKINRATGRVASTPTFQTGAEGDAWMNSTVFIGDGTTDPATGVLTYEVYEVKLG